MRSPRILVVEDERIVALSLCEKLTALGYSPTKPVASGKAALQAIEDDRPDLILMDIKLEGPLDGVETVTRIPADYRIPVIYLTAYSEDATIRRASATSPSGYLIKPISDRDLQATLHITLARHQAEAVFREAEERVREARKMETIGQLAGGVAHDFNNLLTVILGKLEELGELTEDQPEPADLVRSVLLAAIRCEKLTDQLLSFSQRKPHSPVRISLQDFISKMTGGLLQTLGDATQIQLLVPAALWHIKADPDALERALLNLVENAHEAMPDGGGMVFQGENVTLDPVAARALPGMKAGRHVVLTVTDTGRGMSDDVARRAFEPFFTTKPPGQGPGLGLSQVFGFVKQSGGHVAIGGAPGGGTAVTIHFPAADALSEPVAMPAAVIPEARPQSEFVVLVVEDEPVVRQLVCHFLRRMGYDPMEAINGEMAVATLERLPRLDLVITDVIMNGELNGAEFAREALNRYPETKILYMSGYSKDILTQDGVLNPDVQLICKPFGRADLAHMVQRVLTSGPVRDAALMA